jgi:sigma-B regulation protein RsbU (phosphoserine phosphatase)
MILVNVPNAGVQRAAVPGAAIQGAGVHGGAVPGAAVHEASVQQGGAPGGPAGAHLLVVDDIAENRDLLTRRLQRLGHTRIATAADGQEAMAAITAQAAAGTPFDTVLLDVMMPRMSGIEVLEALRADKALAQTPVVMISAATELDTVVRCSELGAEDYLPKPFNPVLLRARLGTVLEKKRLRDQLARQLDRMESELAEARRQQLSMLPDAFPEADAAHPVAVHAVMHPAREVGGDLYDCFVTVPGVLCIAVGDVSDKGMPAALFMARTRSALRASALQHAATHGRPPLPSELMAVLNEELCKNNPICMFVTLFVGFLEVATGAVAFANAGHVRPWRLAPDAAPQEMVIKAGLPLGVMPGARHADLSMTLEKGEALVVITDGLPEMMDADGAFYTLERVEADLAALAGAAPETITTTLAANVLAFAGSAPQADDVTVLALRRLG